MIYTYFLKSKAWVFLLEAHKQVELDAEQRRCRQTVDKNTKESNPM